ncbi:putative ATP-binding cassette transporter [Methylomagnum ishizawai]|uniref:Putative ATP-binding cassette transporter n=1 Tax=Methylomagnum ishizawai TaxID=1760988 RepID=A0A1Y6D4V1_9GAMM|nr:putative ATP-binding cassette transporter [Methylomagnum ishizawai]
MNLIGLMFRRFRLGLLGVLLLSVASAGLTVQVMAFVNERLIQDPMDLETALPYFAGLLAAQFLVATLAQIWMTTLGHRLVYELRRTLVKRVLDTDLEHLETLGPARILASLGSDTGHLTSAFIGLPTALYGVVLNLGGFAYLAWLSPPLFQATLAWMALTVAVAWMLLRRTHARVERAREVEDRLYADYQAVIEGRKELALNRERARRLYEEDFERDAIAGRNEETRADLYNGLNENWANTMILGVIGLCFFLAQGAGWADTGVATTYALTLLFLRTPLAGLVTAVPGLIGGSVALAKLKSLEFPEYSPTFKVRGWQPPATWTRLELDSVTYRYPGNEGEDGFGVGPLHLDLRRGETVFLIGGNGSGKSTFARLLTGLYRPHGGEIRLDGVPIGETRRAGFRRLFAAVFADFHLFQRLLGPDGFEADAADARSWLETLALADKVAIDGGRLDDTRLSQGQRKRLALLLALLEERPILVLDEWAADQDPGFRRFFYTELLPRLKAAGKTVVAITHDEHYFHVADRVLKLDLGEIRETTIE